MYTDENLFDSMKELLSGVLGKAHFSLSLIEKPKRADTVYFYDAAIIKKGRDLLDFFNEKYGGKDDFPYNGIQLPVNDPRMKDVQKDVLVKLVDHGYEKTMAFYPIEGIRFHKSYGKQITASIYKTKPPVLVLWIDEKKTIWSSASDEGKQLQFKWWLNKCLRENRTIRTVLVALLRYVGKENFIFRDVAKTIENDGFFFPPLDFDEIRQCHTPSDLIEKTGVEKLDINYNKLDINVGYYLSSLQGQFDENAGIQLRDYPKENLLNYIQPKDLFEGANAERFLTEHYAALTHEQPWEIRQQIIDYLQMCIDANVKPQILPTYEAFVRKHDEMIGFYNKKYMRFEIERPLVPEKSQFEKVDTVFREHGMKDYEWIKTGEQLFNEGEYQHNCVFTYRASIRKDISAIFHLNRNNESYTIRINKDRNGRFYVAEMRGRFNRYSREEDLAYVNSFLRIANRKDEEETEILEDAVDNADLQLGWNDENLYGIPIEADERNDYLREAYEPWHHEPDEIIPPREDE